MEFEIYVFVKFLKGDFLIVFILLVIIIFFNDDNLVKM